VDLSPSCAAATVTGPAAADATGRSVLIVIPGNTSHTTPATPPSTACATRTDMCEVARRGRPRIKDDVTFRSV
jgi:hypothetical protein